MKTLTFAAYNRDPMGKPERTEVVVHKYHIEHGERANSGLCPLALAFIQHFGNTKVLITPGVIYLGNSSYLMEYELTNIIRDYDKGFTMEPCVIVLR